MLEKSPLSERRIDIVTVLFGGEAALMKVQAKSIARFIEESCIGRIFIIVNELAPESTYAALQRDVLPAYGELLSRIEIVPFFRLMRPHVAADGFRVGQALRLLASRIVSSASYLILDPKTHFMRPMGYSSFAEPKSSKLRTYKMRRLTSGIQEYEAALAYFEASTPEFFMPTRAPFVFKTLLLRQMLDEIETREGAHFDDFFVSNGCVMQDLPLYQAWILAKAGGFEEHYRFGSRNGVGIFARNPSNDEGMDEVLSNLLAEATQTFSLHRKRINTLTVAQWDRIAASWVQAGLCGDANEASGMVNDLKASAELVAR